MVARLTRDTLTFFNGCILYDQNRRFHYTRFSSSISQKSLYPRNTSAPLQLPHRLLFVGRLAPEKGITHLLDVTKQLVASGSPLELHIVGTGALKTALFNRAEALGLTEYVSFHGFVPQGETLRQFYRENDLFVLPSLYDQQPKVLIEAMAHSLPVVATNVGGIPSLIQDGHNGLLVPPAQPAAMASAIRRILADSDLRQKLVRNGLTYARLHTVEHETHEMMQIVAHHFSLEIPDEPAGG
jgi:glycosyltransferase involved in cell wall biosynthesis